MKTIILRPYYAKNGPSIKLKKLYFIDGFKNQALSDDEVFNYIRDGYEIEYNLKNSNALKYSEHLKKNFSARGHLLGLIKNSKKKEIKDINLLNRIIRNGGFVEYIKKLEGNA